MSNRFHEFFSEPVYYEYPYGCLIDGVNNNWDKAREIFFKEFTDNLVPEVHKYVKHYLNHNSNNVKEYWAKWHGYIDDDGQMGNGWVVSPDYYNKKGAKRVFGVVPDKHYFRTGHEWTDTIDNYGWEKFGGSRGRPDGDCLVCAQLKLSQLKGQLLELEQAFSHLTDTATNYVYYNEQKAKLIKEIGYYDSFK